MFFRNQSERYKAIQEITEALFIKHLKDMQPIVTAYDKDGERDEHTSEVLTELLSSLKR